MSKFHINSKGVPAPCKATKGNCPFGGEENHYNNKEEAQIAADKTNQANFGIIPGVGTKIEYSKYNGSSDFENREEFDKNIHFEGMYSLPKKTVANILSSESLNDGTFTGEDVVKAFDNIFKDGGTILKYQSESFNNTTTELNVEITKVGENEYKMTGTFSEYSMIGYEFDNEDGYEEHLETRPDITHDVNCIFNREQIETHLNENMIIDTIGNKEDVPGAINYGLYAIVKENLE